jgi:hypothetical protein
MKQLSSSELQVSPLACSESQLLVLDWMVELQHADHTTTIATVPSGSL